MVNNYLIQIMSSEEPARGMWAGLFVRGLLGPLVIGRNVFAGLGRTGPLTLHW